MRAVGRRAAIEGGAAVIGTHRSAWSGSREGGGRLHELTSLLVVTPPSCCSFRRPYIVPSVKETLDAVSTQGPEGRRTVNQCKSDEPRVRVWKEPVLPEASLPSRFRPPAYPPLSPSSSDTLGPELGKGAFGTVELGVDLQTGEKYAVKEYSKARLRRQVRQRSMAAARGRGIARPGQTSMRELEEQADKNPLSLIAREVRPKLA